MKKHFILTILISSLVASSITAFASGPGTPFPDVDEGSYYSDAIDQMRGMGVMSGYDNGNFGPDDYVTRGQAATMLYRYDNSLLTDPDNTAARVSGVAELVTLLCSLDYSEASDHVQETYDEVCMTDGEY